MDNEQLNIITIVIAAVAFIVGAILIAVRNKAGDKKKKQMLVIVGTALIASAGISLFINSEDVREILVAFAAVFAAVIAAVSIYQSRQMRQDSIDREKRDRKERLINEVNNWLRELESYIFPKVGTLMSLVSVMEDRVRRNPEIPFEYWLDVEDADRTSGEMDSIAKGIAEAQYYQKLTSQLNEELSGSIEIIVSKLEERYKLIIERREHPIDDYRDKEKWSQFNEALTKNADKPVETLGLSEDVAIRVRITRNANAVSKSILTAIDRAIELKTSLIQVPPNQMALL